VYVDSFVLTAESPQVAGGEVVLGAIQDGAFTLPGFPGEVEFGALLELAFDEDDAPGEYEVEIVLEYSRLDGAPQAPLGPSFSVPVPERDPDWWGPRQVAQPLSFSRRFWDEFEGYIVVKVNGEEIGEKALRVLHLQVPDSPSTGND
jgi:hypothetical protein